MSDYVIRATGEVVPEQAVNVILQHHRHVGPVTRARMLRGAVDAILGRTRCPYNPLTSRRYGLRAQWSDGYRIGKALVANNPDMAHLVVKANKEAP